MAEENLGTLLEDFLCKNALDNEKTLSRRLRNTISICSKRHWSYESVTNTCMMVVNSLTKDAPSEYLRKIDHTEVLDFVYSQLERNDDSSVLRYGYLIMERMNRLVRRCLAVDKCVRILYNNCSTSNPIECIDISLEIMMLFSQQDIPTSPQLEVALTRCLSLHDDLSDIAQKSLLCLITKVECMLTANYAERIGTFLNTFLEDLPMGNQMYDIVFRDNVVSYISKIYTKVRNNRGAVNDITTTEVLHHLIRLFKSEEIGPCDKHKLVDILSIIAVNSTSDSNFIMKSGIDKHLDAFFFKSPDSRQHDFPQMGLVVLIWALLPRTPNRDEYKKHNDMRKSVVTPIVKITWRKVTKDGNKIPFTPEHNAYIDTAFRIKGAVEVALNESGNVCSLRKDRKEFKNHTTQEICPIDSAEFVFWKFSALEKTKITTDCNIPTDFVIFMFKMLLNRSYRYVHLSEQFLLLESFLLLVTNMTTEQHKKIFVTAEGDFENYAELFVRYIFIFFEETRNNTKLLTTQILSVLLAKQPDLYAEICKKYGKISEKDGKYSPYLGSKPIKMSPSKFDSTLDSFDNMESELIRIKKLLVDTGMSDREMRYSGTVEMLLVIFLDGAGSKSAYDKKIRMFLHIFANLPLEKYVCDASEVKIDGNSFRTLVRNLNRILNYIKRFDGTSGFHDILKNRNNTGIKTILDLKTRTVRALFKNLYDDGESTTLDVRPFTLIHYIGNKLINKQYNTLKEWNYFKDTEIVIYLNTKRIPSRMTFYEAVKEFGNFANFFESIHVFYYVIEKPPFEPVKHLKERKPFFDYLKKSWYIESDTSKDNALYLLQVLYGLNRHWSFFYENQHHEDIVDSSEFINKEIDRRVDYILRDPFQVLNRHMPKWINEITKCPFLFSFRTKQLIFKVYWMDRVGGLDAVLNGLYSHHDQLIQGPEYRPLVRCARDNILDDFCTGLEHTPTYSNWLVVFEGEFATGDGIKRELFTLVGRELQKEKYNMWHKLMVNQEYLYGADLYPDFNMEVNNTDGDSFLNYSLERKFHMLGQIMGKTLVQGRVLDLPLSLPVFKWLLNEESELRFNDIKYVDPSLFKSLKHIKSVLDETIKVMDNKSLEDETKDRLMSEMMAKWDEIESWGLNFTLPSNENVVLVPDGADISVTWTNAHLYLKFVEEFMLKRGVNTAMEALRTGFQKYAALEEISMFEPAQLQSLLCGHDSNEFWTFQHLSENVKLQGYVSVQSPEVKIALDAMVALSRDERILFLRFLTGTTRLPPDGFAGLVPPFTIMRSEERAWVQTCFHTFHLPTGITKEGIDVFITTAMTVGLTLFDIA